MPKRSRKKMTESQQLIKRLQTRFTNKEITTLLGYKSPSTISGLASGKQKSIEPKKKLAVETILKHEHIRKTVPSKNELDRLRKKVRSERRKNPLDISEKFDEIFGTNTNGSFINNYDVDDWWESSSYEAFINQVKDADIRTKIAEKLSERHLNYFYYNTTINRYLVADRRLSIDELGAHSVTGFMFYFHYEKTLKDGEPFERDDVPIYTWYYILPTGERTSSSNIEYELAQFASSNYDSEHMDKGEDFYSFMAASSEVFPLAYVAES